METFKKNVVRGTQTMAVGSLGQPALVTTRHRSGDLRQKVSVRLYSLAKTFIHLAGQ